MSIYDVISSTKNNTEDNPNLNIEQERIITSSPDNDTIYNQNGDFIIIMDTIFLDH